MCITTEPQFSDHNSYPFNYFCPILAIICPSDLTSLLKKIRATSSEFPYGVTTNFTKLPASVLKIPAPIKGPDPFWFDSHLLFILSKKFLQQWSFTLKDLHSLLFALF